MTSEYKDYNNGLSNGRVLNFGAGPGVLPEEVLLVAQKELMNYQGSGKSIMEMSHRGKEFSKVLDDLKANLISIMKIPDNYDVLFLQGGATSLFAGIPINLCKDSNSVADYIVTGSWSKSAFNEAKHYCKPHAVVDSESLKFKKVPGVGEWKFSKDAAYVYYCDNETVHGVELHEQVYNHVPEGVPIVCDVSSNFLSKPIDVSKYGVIFAGAQKNAGIAGITIVIIRKDLLDRTKPHVPNKKSQQNSVDNTPPTFNLYITGLVLKWIITNGGLEEMGRRNDIKSKKLYEFLDNSNGFYVCNIEKDFRSKMNACFRIKTGDEALEEKLFKEAQQNGITDIRGHRSVGGVRVSLYNAMNIQGVEILLEFLKKFMQENK
ncbi:phosphoserine transaminase [Cavenderia fasciculata]|uniref:Phosphoserine aminotransferase n=1 Tax=Cavenderia fasciculata TaxID=261658 RepID=F4PTJ1_CACFS|nr:phosphoserine transaminase [Cavenderia fasciculata]EGG20873.1 phosphoserine transaminase [Cavenderia fasciculata]|eukprot:XP_004358723.1 phosphoserine transaminase [Cavenderia fasciculata]